MKVYRDVGSEEHAPDDSDFIEVRHIAFDGRERTAAVQRRLSDQVPSGEIRRAVERHAGDPDAAVRELIAKANAAGGKDNVTVVIVEGEQFTRPVREKAAGVGMPAIATLFFAAGVILAAAAGYFTRAMWTPPPVVIAPRVIAVSGSIAAAMADARRAIRWRSRRANIREQVRLKTESSCVPARPATRRCARLR